MKQIIKTESVQAFLNRGGVVKKVNAKERKTYRKAIKEAVFAEEIDLDALPMALKIKYGIR